MSLNDQQLRALATSCDVDIDMLLDNERVRHELDGDQIDVLEEAKEVLRGLVIYLCEED